MPAVGGQHRAWCFTLNNVPAPEDMPESWPDIKYLVYQIEKGVRTNRRHVQGYVLFTKKMSMAACKKVHATAHWEVRRGTHEEARDYCKKDASRLEGPFEFGDEPKPGQRQDLLACKAYIDEQHTEREIWENHFPVMVKYRQSMNYYRALVTPPRNFVTQVAVFYGPTGTGKSKWIRDNIPADKVFYLNRARSAGDPWLDFYDPMQHEHIVLDDYYGWIRWDTFLRMCDWYPFVMETKGAHVQFRAKYIWITSNQRPEDWYDLTIEGRAFETLLRRIHLIRRYTGVEINDYVEERAEPPPEPEPVPEYTFDDWLAEQEHTEVLLDY